MLQLSRFRRKPLLPLALVGLFLISCTEWGSCIVSCLRWLSWRWTNMELGQWWPGPQIGLLASRIIHKINITLLGECSLKMLNQSILYCNSSALPVEWDTWTGCALYPGILTLLFSTSANLSDSYFTNRQDRYVFLQDSPEIADFFTELVDAIGDVSLQLQQDDTVQVMEGMVHPYQGMREPPYL